MSSFTLSPSAPPRAATDSEEGWPGRQARALAQPGSCTERGAVAPFTAPALFAARLRRGAAGGWEVVIPNPSGREGWFVLPWSVGVERFQPSLADRALIAALGSALPTPEALRDAARRMAAQGLAGRAARRAAEACGPQGARPATGRIEMIAAFLADLAEFSRACTTDASRRRLEAFRAQGLSALEAAAAQPAGDPLGASRRDWLLDGWDLLAAAWSCANLEERSDCVLRISALAPPFPVEAEGWAGGAALALAGSPLGGGSGGGITQETAEAALARWLRG